MNYGDFINELLGRSDIVRIVSRYTALTRKGNTYWGCCPFHHEKTPSFTVSADKGLYHCFGCKAGGNVINFVSEIESVDKSEAIRILAKEAGLEVPQRTNDGRDYAGEAQKRERLYKLMREAARHYHENLYLPQAKAAREYLQRREVGENLIKRFGLGYSVSGGEMIEYLESRGYTRAEMKEAGIAAQRADEYYDVFYDRLIFPILTNLGEVVSFGGRVLSQNPDFAKYRNGSQTFIFDKSRNIYAINLLKKRKQMKGLPYIIMTEGYMDVISLHKAGFDTAVASMGTSLTQTQAKLLKNYCDRIYISYDGDGAGQKATLRGLDILAEAGFDIKVIELPDGLDPDDVIKKKGADFYQKLIENAVTLTMFKIKTLKKKYDMSKLEEKSKFAAEAAKIINAQPVVEQNDYLKLLHELTGFTMGSLGQMIHKKDISQKNAAEPELVVAKQSGMDPSLEFILASVLGNEEYCDYTLDIFPFLDSELARRIYEWGLNGFKSGNKQGLAEFVERTPEEDRQILHALLGYRFKDGDDKEKFRLCFRNLQINALEAEKKNLAEQSKKAVESAELYKYAKQIQDIDKQIRSIRKGAADDE